MLLPVAFAACPVEGAAEGPDASQLRVAEGLKVDSIADQEPELAALLARMREISSRIAERALRRLCPWAPAATDLLRWLRDRAPRVAVDAVLDRITASSDLRACGSLAATCVALRDASARSADWLERLVLLRFPLLEALRQQVGTPLGSARDMFAGQAGVVRAFRAGAPLRSAAPLDDVVFALDVVVFDEVSETSQRSLHSCRGTVVLGELETTIVFAVPHEISARAALASERGNLELRVLATRLGGNEGDDSAAAPAPPPGRARAVEHAVLYDGMFSDYDGEILDFETDSVAVPGPPNAVAAWIAVGVGIRYQPDLRLFWNATPDVSRVYLSFSWSDAMSDDDEISMTAEDVSLYLRDWVTFA